MAPVTDAVVPRACARRIASADVAELVERLFSAERDVPIVAVTTSAATGLPHLDENDLATRLGDRAHVVLIETGDVTWSLSEAMPDMLDVYGGAARIWWPGLTREDSPYDHPLLFARSSDDGVRVLRRILDAIRPARESLPDPWERVAAEYRVGDVVWGVVQNTKPFGVFVELLPRAVGLVHKGEVDWTFVEDPAEFVTLGEQVKVQILRLDAKARQADLSIKRAWNREPRAPLAGEAGGRPLLEESPVPVPDGATDGVAALQAETLAELEGLREERKNLLRRVRELQKQVRSSADRLAHLERQGHTDPTTSEPAFLQGVRTAYARLFTEDERAAYPLRRMRVGGEFLARLRDLDGIAMDKVLDVCAQVAANRAHEIPAREVHRLRQGEKGAGSVTRLRDGAVAWRCSLQDSTPAARRLHWWAIPGPDGGSIEFAAVGVHDDYSIPE